MLIRQYLEPIKRADDFDNLASYLIYDIHTSHMPEELN